MTGFSIAVKVDVSSVQAALTDKFKNQLPFAVALGLTRLAQKAQNDVTFQLPTIFDRPNPFTMSAIAIQTASKTTLTSSVYIKPQQAEYLSVEISGGTVYPAGRALPVGVDTLQTIYGGLPLGAVKRALRQPNTFSGIVHGIPGVWQRVSAHRLILLIRWDAKWQYKQRFDFAGVLVNRSVQSNVDATMSAAVAQAVSTAT